MSIESAALACACAAAVAVSHTLLFQQRAKSVLVHTSRGIPNAKPELAVPPCVKCGGTGKVTCGSCNGLGACLPACLSIYLLPGCTAIRAICIEQASRWTPRKTHSLRLSLNP